MNNKGQSYLDLSSTNEIKNDLKQVTTEAIEVADIDRDIEEAIEVAEIDSYIDEVIQMQKTPKDKLNACNAFVTASAELSSQTDPAGKLAKLAGFFRQLFTKKDSLDHQKNMKILLTTIKSQADEKETITSSHSTRDQGPKS